MTQRDLRRYGFEGTRGVEMLEPRRLFAYDLMVTAVDADVVLEDRFIDWFSFVYTIKNAGPTAFPGGAELRYALSKNSVPGDADDIPIGDWPLSERSARAPGESRELEIHGDIRSIPRVPPGDYHVVSTIAITTAPADGNPANNTHVTDTPVVTVTAGAAHGDSVMGTAGDDLITIRRSTGYPRTLRLVSVNGTTWRVQGKPFIDAGSGNDKVITLGEIDFPLRITGSGGNDTIVGGAMNDELSGANGKDKVFGGAGHDYLLGGASKDYLNGEAGDDIMSGAGGNDRLADVVGRDYFLGGAGNDVLLTRDGPLAGGPDTLSGGGGRDLAQADELELFASVEEMLA